MIDERMKVKAAYFLGYTSNKIGGGLGFGQPTLIQHVYPALAAIDHLTPEEEPIFLRIIDTMDMIENKQAESVDYLVASKVDDVTMRSDYTDRLADEMKRWRRKLCNLLGINAAPWVDAGSGINVPRVC